MPLMRSFTPFRANAPKFYTQLPIGDPLNPHLRVAVFDGGLPTAPDLSGWVSTGDAGDVGPIPDQNGLKHGLAVTSALLFGPIEDGTPLRRPVTTVEHFRVADNTTNDGPNYYRILNRIVEVLVTEHYDYINVSLGPDVSMEDNIIYAWTGKLDDVLSHGKTLAFFAAGNRGDNPRPEDRIGPPADAINGIGVGSCDCSDGDWNRSAGIDPSGCGHGSRRGLPSSPRRGPSPSR